MGAKPHLWIDGIAIPHECVKAVPCPRERLAEQIVPKGHGLFCDFMLLSSLWTDSDRLIVGGGAGNEGSGKLSGLVRIFNEQFDWFYYSIFS